MVNQINNAVNAYGTTNTKKTEETANTNKQKVSGKTVGNPQLSDKAAKYYEELQKKYSNMDFILVSEDQKEQAQAQAGSYANPYKMVVLIDEAKIEKMAEDKSYRDQYESIIANAASGISQLKEKLSSSGTAVQGFGMKVNDHGTASYFAVLKKSSSTQKSRLNKKVEEKKAAKKAADKKAEKEAFQERLHQKKDGVNSNQDEDTITISASSIEELLNKISDYTQNSMTDEVQTEEEKKVGQKFDFSV